MPDDLYAVLELSPAASQEDVNKAYKRMALRWHPDKNAENQEEAERRFRQIAQAYEVLSNPNRRSAYDLERNLPRGPSGGPAFYAGSSSDEDFEGFQDPDEVFRQFFQASWAGWPDAERAEWEGLFSRGPHSGAQLPPGVFLQTTTITMGGGPGGTQTVRKSVTQNGVTTTTVIYNGEVVEQTVSNATAGMSLRISRASAGHQVLHRQRSLAPQPRKQEKQPIKGAAKTGGLKSVKSGGKKVSK